MFEHYLEVTICCEYNLNLIGVCVRIFNLLKKDVEFIYIKLKGNCGTIVLIMINDP